MQAYLFAPNPDYDVTGLADPSIAGGLTLADARPYQQEWAARTMELWATGQRALGVAATGIGKTWLAALLARRILDGELTPLCPANYPAMLFIAHRTKLVQQAAASFNLLLPDTFVEVEQGEARARGDGGVIAACLPSLAKLGRLRAFGKKRVQAVVWDEAHRYGPNNKYMRRVMDFFGPDVRHLGVTATPDRGDGVGLESVFHRIAFEYGIWEAVRDGWLVPPYLAYEISGDVSLSGIPVGPDGDFDSDALSAKMMEAGPVAAVVKAAIKWSNHENGREGKRQVVVCAASVDCAKLCAIALNEWHRVRGTGRAVAVVDGQDGFDRDAAYAGFESGEIRYLCHYDVLTEGFDSDKPKIVVNGRPTKKRWIVAQNAGRALRPARDVANKLATLGSAEERRALIRSSSKPGALIVDVAGTDHKLTVDLASVFYAKGATPADIEAVREKARERAKDGKASDPVADWASIKKLREMAREDEWRGVLVDVELTTRMSDPFDVLKVTPGREPPWVKGRRPTAKMRGVMIRAGIPTADVNAMTFWKARAMIDTIFERRDLGLCTYNQVKLLRDYGIDGNGLTFEAASERIDAIARAGWKVPEDAA